MESNKNKVLTIIRTYPVVSGFLIPILIIFILNLGLIFKWSLWLNFEPITSIVNYLSIRISYDIPAEYFIGIITIFILFFSFAQFSYSRQALPANLVRKHILVHHNTFLFIGLQFSFSTIIGFFTFVNTHSIRNFNFIIVLTVLLSSVLISIIYFYWLVRNVTAVGMFQLIRNNLNFDEIRKIEIETEKSFQSFLEAVQSEKFKLKFTLFDYLGFILDEHTPIQTDKIGIIKSIDLKKIDEILDEYSKGIKEIILDIKIGQRIPLHDTYPGIIPKTNLFRIFTIPTYQKDIIEIKEKLRARLIEDKSFYTSLVDCFDIDVQSVQFERNKEHLNDLVHFYTYAIETETAETDDLMGHFSSFIFNQVGSLQPDSTIKLGEKLFLEIIDRFNSNLKMQGLSIVRIETALNFIYSMGHAAVKGKSFLIISKLLSLLMYLFGKYVDSDLVSSKRIHPIILYIQEISFSEIVYTRQKIDKSELLKYYKSFYLPLVSIAIEKAAMAFYLLIKSEVNKENSDKKILYDNAQHLIDFLSPINHWDPVEELAMEGSSHFQKEHHRIVKSHGENILHLAVLIFKYAREGKLPINSILNIAFPLVDNCYTIKKFAIRSEEFVDEFFFSYEFRELTSSFLQEEFEGNKIHEAGTYSPAIYSFRDFWLTYSLYLGINADYRKPYKVSFIPSADLGKTTFSKSKIFSMINRLQTISVKDLMKWLNKDEEFVREIMMKYGSHLKKLFEENKEDFHEDFF